HPLGVDFRRAGFDTFDDFLRVAAGDHHHDSADRFGVTALEHRAVTNVFANLDTRHVADVDGSGTHLFQHDGLNVGDVLNQPEAAHQQNFGTLRHDAATGV